MTAARKTIDLHGQDPAELARELATLPQGRYVLVSENELEGDEQLSAEDEAAIEQGLDEIERGDVVDADEVFAAALARLDASGAR